MIASTLAFATSLPGKLAMAALALSLAFGAGWLNGASATKLKIEKASAKAAMDRIIEMEKNNANFRNLPERDRCIVFMRDSGLPIGACD